jgi:hypothetical protein
MANIQDLQRLQNSGFYNFRFTDTTGASYVSDLYSIKVIKDRSPEIEIEGLNSSLLLTTMKKRS